MKTEKKLELCLRELLFGESFLSEYKRELEELLGDPAVMEIVDAISASVPEETEFPLEENSEAQKEFKKKTVSEAFFDTRFRYRFPAYQDILEKIAERGKTKLSATISVYYALRYMDMSKGAGKTAAGGVPATPASKASELADVDFRKKWEAAYRCEDGHYVRSKNEQLVDNWLYHHNVCHAYESLVVDKRNGKEYINDFYLPQLKVYIEVWGFETPEYLARKKRKIEAYQANKLKLLQMTDKDIKNLDDFMKRSLSALKK